MANRIYHVINNATGGEKLVEAALPAQVIRHVAKALFTIEPVKQADLVRLLTQESPLKVERAVADEPVAQAGTQAEAPQAGADVAQEGDSASEGGEQAEGEAAQEAAEVVEAASQGSKRRR